MTYGKTADRTVISCWPAAGDRVKFFPPKAATVSIVYNLGADFHSCPAAERSRRAVSLCKLFQSAMAEVAAEIDSEFRNGSPSIEAPKLLTGEKLKAKLKEIDRKHSKSSLVVQGGLPSLGKRQ